ncbi:hypothetical protein FQN50_004130 [Emmonsiellopsis sp. PD_5]|nr:hypothetical protein FQN50_004130 [Emmonsiellopsis sp. PD_5]
MPLTALPNEILLQISTSLTSPQDLNAVARTSSALHALANPLLYRKGTKGKAPAVWWAVENGRPRTLQLCLDAGFKLWRIRRKLDQGGGGLFHAIVSEDREYDSEADDDDDDADMDLDGVVRLLTANGARIDSPNAAGQTALALAITTNDTRAIWALLHGSASLHTQPTLLHLAVAADVSLPILAHLLDNGLTPSLNTRDDDDLTPLHHAARHPSPHAESLLTFLLSRGADLTATTDPTDGTTLLHTLTDTQTHLIPFLTQPPCNLDINTRDSTGQTPLHSAARTGEEAVIRALAAAGADINPRDQLGMTPLHWILWACGRPCPDNWVMPALEALVEVGADVAARNDAGESVVHLGVQGARDEDVFGYVLGLKGVEIDGVDGRGWTGLHCAVGGEGGGGEWRLARLLVRFGADVRRRTTGGGEGDGAGQTALHIFAERGEYEPEFLGWLVEAGLDVHEVDGRGVSAYEYLRRKGMLGMLPGEEGKDS